MPYENISVFREVDIFYLAVWSYLNRTIVIVLEEKIKKKLTFF